MKKIQILYFESVIRKGKVVIRETTAAPPAKLAIKAGKTQHNNVEVDVSKETRLSSLSFFNKNPPPPPLLLKQ